MVGLFGLLAAEVVGQGCVLSMVWRLSAVYTVAQGTDDGEQIISGYSVLSLQEEPHGSHVAPPVMGVDNPSSTGRVSSVGWKPQGR